MHGTKYYGQPMLQIDKDILCYQYKFRTSDTHLQNKVCVHLEQNLSCQM